MVFTMHSLTLGLRKLCSAVPHRVFYKGGGAIWLRSQRGSGCLKHPPGQQICKDQLSHSRSAYSGLGDEAESLYHGYQKE